MNRWLLARKKAYQIRKALEAKEGRELYGTDLINMLIDQEELSCVEVAADDVLLEDEDGNSQARYYSDKGFIVVQQDLTEEWKLLLKGHELGHHFLHTRTIIYSTNSVDPTSVVLTLPYAEGRIATYNSRQMHEHEATVFALELLIPSERLASLFDAGHTTEEFVTQFQMQKSFLFAQMSTALLMPVPNYDQLLAEADALPFHWVDLDDSQKIACCAPSGPVLVQAGPGTGKTRTLTSRIEWLIMEEDVPPEHILALTFSNKATEELRFRLRNTLPNKAHQVTVTNFHGFGLELLRRYAEQVGLPPDFTVLDPLEVEMLLEAHLAKLGLNYFADPTIPDQFLSEIVTSISSAKEELIDVATCENLVSSSHFSTLSSEIVQQYQELSHVYRVYEEILHSNGFVDYGDLILKPVQLLRNSLELRKQLHDQYIHILVDEYQDINQANGELVHLLVGEEGTRLWAVGDLRQSIYRWRGASSVYLQKFREQFPHRTELFLEVNYRSSEQLVSCISHFAAQMKLPVQGRPWTAHRGEIPNSSIRTAVADDKKAELDGLGAAIKQFVQDGVGYADIAILCRTNGHAGEIASSLGLLGIPTLHLGKFPFRAEIKDLLSVLALITDVHSVTWARVASLLREPLSLPNAIYLWHRANMANVPFPMALRSVLDDALLSQDQREDLEHIAELVERHQTSEEASPWKVLCEFLFENGSYLRQLRTSSRADQQQVLLAVAQLLNLANAFGRRHTIGDKERPIQTFLTYIRRMIKRDDNDIDLPITDIDVDAVRILTIHKAKGLEFPVVFVPNLAERRFPSKGGKPPTVPKLSWLVRKNTADEEAVEEQSCLFVAISRARDHLILSRAASYEARRGKPVLRQKSELWQLLDPCLRALSLKVSSETWQHTSNVILETIDADSYDQNITQQEDTVLDLRAIRVYQRCPRQYFYRHVLKLAIRDARDIYLQFNILIYQIAEWLRAELANGRLLEWPTVVEHLDQEFHATLSRDHVHFAWYRQQAEMQVRILWLRLIDQVRSHGKWQNQVPAEIELEGNAVKFTIDEIAETDDQRIITIYRTGRATKSQLQRPKLALARRFVQSLTDLPVQINLHYLATNTVEMVPANTDAKILRDLSEDITNIQRGHFPSKPSDSRFHLVCASCSFLFLCPGGAANQSQEDN